TDQVTQLVRDDALVYRQIDTAHTGEYRIVKTYVSDPRRPALLVDVRFASLSGRPYQVYVLSDPSLTNDGMDDTGTSQGSALLAHDGTTGSALVGRPAFTQVSNGYLGVSDGWTDLKDDFRLDWS